ncbi:hypothetical protein [Microvirga roseola]|uniref:hypothetical protein n=1 Tax=Microvirga roseola TaxID=2883126 RepID=UPI001E364DB2|nr:hypothetical protein [Microvirga roseola]
MIPRRPEHQEDEAENRLASTALPAADPHAPLASEPLPEEPALVQLAELDAPDVEIEFDRTEAYLKGPTVFAA